jgi:hypothetical protein
MAYISFFRSFFLQSYRPKARQWTVSIAQQEREWNSVSRLQQTIFPEGEVSENDSPRAAAALSAMSFNAFKSSSRKNTPGALF